MTEQQQIPLAQAEIPRSVVEELQRSVVAKICRTRLGGRAHDGYNSYNPHELEDAAEAAVTAVVAAGWRPPTAESDGRAVPQDAAVKLLEYALHLRMYGECAPGGDETWLEWDARAEAFLRSLTDVTEETE